MSDQNPTSELFEKDIDWSGIIGVTVPVSEVQVYQRAENIDLKVMDDGVLRIQAALKLFAMVAARLDEKHIFNPAQVFTNVINVNAFLHLKSRVTREDILSIDYDLITKNYAVRPDSIIISGTLRLRIKYIMHLVLEGVVLDFASNRVINGATVNVKDQSSGEIKASTTTGSDGRYFFNNLHPGIYLVEAFTDSHMPLQKVSVIKTWETVNFILHQ